MLTAALAVSAASSDTLTVRVKGMRCEECAHKVRVAVKELAGVDGMKFNLERRTVSISYDPAQVTPLAIRDRLAATKRYAATDYSPNDTIRRGFGLRMDDMFCMNCANRIMARLQKMEGIDSLAPHVDKHYMFIRYDANRQTKDSIRAAILQLGFTPVNYYSGPKVAFAYYNIPAESATLEALESIIALDAVDDVTVNPRRKSLAITYFKEEITPEKLLAEVRAAGIDAVVPAPHECKEQGE